MARYVPSHAGGKDPPSEKTKEALGSEVEGGGNFALIPLRAAESSLDLEGS